MTSRRLRFALMFAVAVGSAASADEMETTSALVQRAYDRTLRAPGVRSVDLAIHRGERLVSRRAFDVAYRADAAASQSLLRFTAPSSLRGNALLLRETASGASDVWMYRSDERRPRRLGAMQRSDAFCGSDLSFEELEHPRFARWQLERRPVEDTGVIVIDARPPGESQYGRLVIWIDTARLAIARIDFFRGTEREPVKRLSVALDGVREQAGFLRIERMRIEQVGRNAWTDMATSRMEIAPSISPALFSTAGLERDSDDLYALALRRDDDGVGP